MSVDFERPPINEVAVGAFFSPIAALKAEAVGLFWGKIRQELPKATQAAPLTPMVPMPGEVLPMVRFWFSSVDETRLVQLQRDAFLFNWRRGETDYPRFEQIKAEFDRYFSLFKEFVRHELGLSEIDLSAFELTYVNVMGKGEGLTEVADYSKVVPDFRLQHLGGEEGKAQDFNYATAFRHAEDLQLLLTHRSARRLDNQELSFLLELKATGASKAPMEEWFRRAHDLIIKVFVSITNSEIQEKIWLRR
jgi:uncharacterized protein (TIGR04255 family)